MVDQNVSASEEAAVNTVKDALPELTALLLRWGYGTAAEMLSEALEDMTEALDYRREHGSPVALEDR